MSRRTLRAAVPTPDREERSGAFARIGEVIGRRRSAQPPRVTPRRGVTAGVGVATVVAVVAGSAVAAAPAAADVVVPANAQSYAAAQLLDVSLLDPDFSLLALTGASAAYPGDDTTEYASVDLSLLGSANLLPVKLDLPLIDSADRPGLLSFGDDAALGVVKGFATAPSAANAKAASGLVSDQGAIELAPADASDDYASLNLTALFDQLGIDPLTDGILDEAALKVGVLSSSAEWTAGTAPKSQYAVAGLKLNLSSPAVKGLTGTIDTAVAEVSDTVNALLGSTGAVQQTLNALDAIELKLGVANLSLGEPKLSADVKLDEVTAGILREPLKSDDGLVSIDLSEGVITVDLAQLHGGNLNGLPANTDLLTAEQITQITETVTDLLGNVVQKVTDAVTAALLTTKITVALTPKVEVLAGVVGSDLGVKIEGTLAQFLGQDVAGTKPEVKISGSLTLLGLPIPLGKILDVIVSPLLTTLVPAIGSALQPVLATASTVVEDVLNAVINPLVFALDPVLRAVLSELVSITINQQSGGPAQAGQPQTVFSVSALAIDVVPSADLASLTLANSAVITAGTAATGLSPVRGPSSGGTVVTVQGTGLDKITSVTFGGVAGTNIVHVDDNTLRVTAPAADAPGAVDVVLGWTENGTPMTTGPLTYTYTLTPTISGMTPTRGTVDGGTTVTLTGTGFTGATGVTLGGTAATSFTVNSDTSITFTTPAHAAGPVGVVVTSVTGNPSAPATYTYVADPTVTVMSPTFGTDQGGTLVTITGTNFTPASTVTFGNKPGTLMSVSADGTTIKVLTPARGDSPLTVPVTVVSNIDGVPNVGTPIGYTYNVVAIGTPPTITGVSPVSGPLGGGTSVTVTGTNFRTTLGSTTIIIGGNELTPTNLSTTSATVVVPAGVQPGPVNVIVLTAGLAGANPLYSIQDVKYTYLSGPQITAITPVAGPTSGASVTITGQHFNTDSIVLVDGVALPASQVTRNSATQLTATLPVHAAGAVQIQVRSTGEGTAVAATAKIDSNAVPFTYVAAPTIGGNTGAWQVTPTEGPTSGGTVVTITGTGFIDGETTVGFGDSFGSNVQVINATTMRATTPPHAAGTVDVTVSTVGGTATAADAFTYFAVPTATTIDPASGSTLGGDNVTIEGTGFVDGRTSVTLTALDGSTVQIPAADVTVTDAGTLTFATPAHDAGRVTVSVTTPGGTTAGLTYTFIAPPTLTALTPQYGPTSGGTTVTITGSGFVAGASEVQLDGVAVDAADVTVASVTSIVFTTPAHAAGPVDVTVTGPGGESAAGVFTFVDAPTIDGITNLAGVVPVAGPDTGGDTVTITGTGFVPGVTTVTFGGQAGTNVTVAPDGQSLTVTTPAGTAGLVDVVVTTPGGTATQPDAYTYVATPALFGVDPAVVSVAGGVAVTLLGSNLDAVTTLVFDGASLTEGTDYTIAADGSSITLLSVPAHVAGSVSIEVENSLERGDTTSLTYGELPTITDITPSIVSTAGGTVVTLTVDNLAPTAAPVVLIEGKQVTVASSTYDPATGLTEVVVTAPARTLAGDVDVVVVDNTTRGASAPETLTYAAVPTIDPQDLAGVKGINPNFGPTVGGTDVTITGAGFIAGTTVTFDGVPGTAVDLAADGTSLTVTTPAHTAGAVNVVVTTALGSATSTDGFTYLDAPTIDPQDDTALTGILPSEGPAAGGTDVTITGTGFIDGETTVSFGDTAGVGVIVAADGLSLTVTTPAHAAGSVDVSVTTPGGTATRTDGFDFLPELPPTPVVEGLQPGAGPLVGGTTVTVTGENFTPDAVVTIDGVEVATTFVDSTTVTFVTPEGAQPGDVVVAVATPGGTSNEVDFTYVEAPVVSSIDPNSGPVAGGQTVTIEGSGFGAGTMVDFGGDAGTNVVVAGDGESLTVTTPAHAAGGVVVSVTNAGGTATAQYTYVAVPVIDPQDETDPAALKGINPTEGPTTGGTIVTITGSGFVADGTEVSFDGDAGNDVTVAADGTSLEVETPAHAAGAVDVVIDTAGGTATRTDGFTYVVAPRVPTAASIDPASGPLVGGNTATITGTDFVDGETTVTVGGAPATNVVVSPDGTEVSFTVPAGTAPGAVEATVTTPGGTTAGVGYTYNAPVVAPTATSLSPTSGPLVGGNPVTVTGTGFVLGQTTVLVGTMPGIAPAVSPGGSTVTFIVPAGIVPGAVNVTVTTPDGTTDPLQYTYLAPTPPAPTATSIAPESGPLAGGTSVTITGTGFLPAVTTVSVGGTLATGVTVSPDGTQVTFTVPASTVPGAVDVTVTTPNGTTDPVEYTYEDAPIVVPTASTIEPASGPILGGNTATIDGTGFVPGDTTVTVDGVPATNVVVSPDGTEVSFTVPAGAAPGTVDVIVSTPVASTDPIDYTYVAVPTISTEAGGLSPDFGPTTGGTEVTVSGTGFIAGATSVTISAFTILPADVTVTSATELTFETPAHPAGAVDVTVRTAGGTSNPQSFNYFEVPTAATIDPVSGPIAGGNTATIDGTGFVPGETTVTVGGIEATDVVVSPDGTAVSFTVPAGTAPGAVDVIVTTPGGDTDPIEYTYEEAPVTPAPVIDVLAPASGPIAGGTTVTITGSGFTGMTAVTVDGTTIPGAVVVNDTTITFVTPAHAAGAVEVTVTTPAGTSNEGTFTYVDATAPAPTASTIDPTSGPLAGGNEATISGTDFVADETTVLVDGVPSTDVVVSPDGTEVTFTVPAGTAPGVVDVVVSTPSGSAPAIEYTYEDAPAPAPTADTIAPATGPVTGGNTVTIDGTGFVPGETTVTVDGVPATNVVVSTDGTEVTFTVPAGTAPGVVDVIVTTPGGSTDPIEYTYVAVPTISTGADALSPDFGPTSGGTEVTVTGTGFIAGATEVSVGAFTIVPADVTVDSATSLTFETPAHAAGPVDVTVTTVGGTSNAQTFTYYAVPTADTIAPATGPIAGGNTVTIDGTGFVPGETTVTVDGIPATDVVVSPDGTEVTFTVPAGTAPGVVDVIVTTPGGSTDPIEYTYEEEPAAVPTADTIAPASGPLAGGNTVTVDGTGFVPGETTVTVDGVPATDVVVSPDGTEVSFTVPAGTAPGVVDVIVTTPGGSTDPIEYTYEEEPAAVPTADTIAPATGPVTGGNTVTIDGTGFVPGETTVTVDGVPATNVVVSTDGTEVTFTVPAGTAPGVVDVIVTTPGGSTDPIEYTYVAVPTISTGADALSPDFGPTSGGTEVTVTGTGFIAGATEVSVGAFTIVPADVTVDSATSLTFETPAHAAGPVDVTVTTVGGTSNAQTFTYYAVPTADTIAPATGPVTGGNTATIDGTGFVPGETTVTVDGVPATDVVVSPDGTEVTFTVPAGTAPGVVDVIVTTPGGSTDPIEYTYEEEPAAVPTADTIAPASGPLAGGNTVTIDGTGFVPGETTVTVGGVEVTDVVVSPDGTEITFTVPAGTAPGVVDVIVTTPGGSTDPIEYTYEDAPAAPAPAIDTIAPASGPTEGGTTVTVTGSGFTDATGTTFAGTEGTDFVVVDDETITVVTPPNAAGDAAVIITSPNGDSAASTFTYVDGAEEHPAPVVTGMTPVQGPTAGGTEVTITGTGFSSLRAISFGDVAGDAGQVPAPTSVEPTIGTNTAGFIVVSDTKVIATTPPHAVGPVDVVLDTLGGAASAGTFTYVEDDEAPATELPPVIGGITPDRGDTGGGTVVTIDGSDLDTATEVLVDGESVPFVVNEDGSISITMPPHAAGTVDIVVVTPGGSSNAATFTYEDGAGGGSGGPGGPGSTPSEEPDGKGDGLAVTGQNGEGQVAAVLLGILLVGVGTVLIRRRKAGVR